MNFLRDNLKHEFFIDFYFKSQSFVDCAILGMSLNELTEI